MKSIIITISVPDGADVVGYTPKKVAKKAGKKHTYHRRAHLTRHNASWTATEDDQLIALEREFRGKKKHLWKLISHEIGRTAAACEVRWLVLKKKIVATPTAS